MITQGNSFLTTHGLYPLTEHNAFRALHQASKLACLPIFHLVKSRQDHWNSLVLTSLSVNLGTFSYGCLLWVILEHQQSMTHTDQRAQAVAELCLWLVEHFDISQDTRNRVKQINPDLWNVLFSAKQPDMRQLVNTVPVPTSDPLHSDSLMWMDSLTAAREACRQHNLFVLKKLQHEPDADKVFCKASMHILIQASIHGDGCMRTSNEFKMGTIKQLDCCMWLIQHFELGARTYKMLLNLQKDQPWICNLLSLPKAKSEMQVLMSNPKRMAQLLGSQEQNNPEQDGRCEDLTTLDHQKVPCAENEHKDDWNNDKTEQKIGHDNTICNPLFESEPKDLNKVTTDLSGVRHLSIVILILACLAFLTLAVVIRNMDEHKEPMLDTKFGFGQQNDTNVYRLLMQQIQKHDPNWKNKASDLLLHLLEEHCQTRNSCSEILSNFDLLKS